MPCRPHANAPKTLFSSLILFLLIGRFAPTHIVSTDLSTLGTASPAVWDCLGRTSVPQHPRSFSPSILTGLWDSLRMVNIDAAEPHRRKHHRRPRRISTSARHLKTVNRFSIPKAIFKTLFTLFMVLSASTMRFAAGKTAKA